MVVEMQLAKGELSFALVNRIRAERICITDEFTYGQQTYLVDHMEVSGAVSFTAVDADIPVTVADGSTVSVEGAVLDVTVPVAIQFVTLSDLAISGEAAAPPAFPLDLMTIHIHFRLSAGISGGIPVLSVRYDHADLGMLFSSSVRG